MQYDLLCGNCFDFLLWVKFEFYSEIVFVDCCNFLTTKNLWLIFSISPQLHSDCPEYSGVSCAGLAIFAISLLLLMIFPSVQVILPESGKYLMYSKAVDPAVSCKKIDPVL